MTVAPRVFISYSHDSAGHKLRVLELANTLRQDGIDARIDRYVSFPSEGWPRWMTQQVDEADAVLIVCSETYKERFNGAGPAKKGLGVRWEGLILTQALYEDMASNNAKFIPVLFEETSATTIPAPLRPFTYFQLPNQYDDLLRILTNQPEVEMPAIGATKRLPANYPAIGAGALPVVSAGADQDLQTLSEDAADVLPISQHHFKPSWAKINGRALEILRERWNAGRLTLILGAGVSVGSGLPTWSELINDLMASYVQRTYSGTHGSEKTYAINAALADQFRNTSPIQTAEFIKSRMSTNDFLESMKASLYKANDQIYKPNSLISAIIHLGAGIHAIVSFNYDDLIERALQEAQIDFTSVIEGRDLNRIHGIPVYHPHGYLPRQGASSTSIVFSESQYHTQYAENNSWTNIVVQRLLLESTCLFVGTSLSDPNLRRIIDLSHRQNTEQRHFYMTLAPRQSEKYLSQAVTEIQQASYEAIGVVPIWLESCQEAATILSSIRSTEG